MFHAIFEVMELLFKALFFITAFVVRGAATVIIGIFVGIVWGFDSIRKKKRKRDRTLSRNKNINV